MPRIPTSPSLSALPIRPPAPLSSDQFSSPEQLKIALPALVVGIRIPEYEFYYVGQPHNHTFRPGRKWQKIAHRIGPGGRRKAYILGTVLAAKCPLDGFERFKKLAAEPGLMDVLDYAEWVEANGQFEATCLTSFRELASGLYPIDLPSVRGLAAEPLPDSFDDWIQWPNGFARAAHGDQWSAYVIGECAGRKAEEIEEDES